MNLTSLQHLQTSLGRIDPLIRAAVARAQAAGQDPTDALRGLVISEEEIERQLDQVPLSGLWDSADEAPTLFLGDDATDLPFVHLVRAFQLTTLDAYILLLCLAPEFDRRYERLYAYLQDDVSQRRPSVNLLMNILGVEIEQRFGVWERLTAHAPLRRHHLIEAITEGGRQDAAFLAYSLKVDYRIVAYLLGDMSPDARLKQAVNIETPDIALPALVNPMPDAPVIYLRGAEHTGQLEAALDYCQNHDLPLVSINMGHIKELEQDQELFWRLALREAYLANAAVFVEKWDVMLDDDHHQAPLNLWNMLQEYPLPVFICGKVEWEPLDIHRRRRILRQIFSIPAYPERRKTWDRMIAHHEIQVDAHYIEELANKFRFTHRQIMRAVQTAADIAASRREPVTPTDLYAGAQAHASLRLGRLATRIHPRFEWDDLILPPDQLAQLKELTDRAMHVHRVHNDWGFGRKISPAARVSALFAGESGTGKTLSAEVIANMLGLILYKIDLSSVVSKYIGETEKNLGAIFEEARSSNAILFFDEADALFGKRSEVKDARDRYANIEVAYLLQQIENYDGVAIMATNLRQNLDEAFTRRLDFVIDFPFPEAEYRRRIWAAHFPSDAPLSEDVNLDELAHQYRLAGGNIRNAAIAAAFLAAADDSIITMTHVRNAIRREHQKMGRLLDEFVKPGVKR